MPNDPARSTSHPSPEGREGESQSASAAREAPAVLGASAAKAADGSGAADGSEKSGAAEDAPFGAQAPSRFAADVEYCGSSRRHDYVVRVRHRLLDTSATVVIDGVEHDPKAEEKARKKAVKEPAAEIPGDDADAEAAHAADDAGAADGEAESPPADDLQFRCEDGFTSLRFTVRRPDADGDHEDAEVIHVRTVGLGGAGEVDVRRGFDKVLLVPEEGSPSAAREKKRAAHPTRFALIAALATSARYLIPLLGLGALFSGLLDPLKEWVERMVRPIIEAVVAFLVPIRDWISELTRPVREFLSELTRPVRELLAALLRPVRDAVSWLMELLFGWIPDLSLPFSIPGWVVDVAIPVIVVISVFVVTFRQLRHRRARLERTRQASAGAVRESAGDAGEPARGADEDRGDSSSTAPPSPER